MSTDKFDRPGDLNSPAYFGSAVSPNDSSDLVIISRALYVGSAGNLTVLMAGDGAEITFNSIPAGTLLPLAVIRVKSTGTTAGNIVSVW